MAMRWMMRLGCGELLGNEEFWSFQYYVCERSYPIHMIQTYDQIARSEMNNDDCSRKEKQQHWAI